MSSIKDFLTGQADLTSNRRFSNIAGGIACISMGTRSKNKVRKWLAVIAGTILIARGLTNKPVGKKLLH